MQYRNDRRGNPISTLGFGCMRFPKKGNSIDQQAVTEQIRLAYENGVNYFDTAYVYPGSEAALGNALETLGIREKINIATKLPQYLVRKADAFDKYFYEELKRLKTDHIDYYLMHMMTDYTQWENLHALGIEEWVREKKEKGQIGQIGFSFHGSTDMFEKILNAYDWDFCQIQYNYYDEHHQAGVSGLKLAAEKKIPVIIMEPLRGGKLVNLLPEKAKKKIAQDEHGWTAAEWSFRWLWNQEAVTCVLSGMNSEAMVRENMRTADLARANTFTEKEFTFLREICDEINASVKVGCTGCRYCMPCPKGVDIPALFLCWNEMYTEHKHSGRNEYFMTVGLQKDPAFASQCVKCGKCEAHCPQHLPIRDLLVEADKDVRPFYMKAGINIARKFMVHK